MQSVAITSRHAFIQFKELLTRKSTNGFDHLNFNQFLPLGVSSSLFNPVKTGGNNQFLPPPANHAISKWPQAAKRF